jgi:hypothetical protein
MKNEWITILQNDLIKLLEKEKNIIKNDVKQELVLIEEDFFKKYGSKPISFFQASDQIIEQIKTEIPNLLSKNKISAIEFVSNSNNNIKDKYFEKINNAMFKTTLGVKTSDLEKDLKNQQSELSRKLKEFINFFYKDIHKIFISSFESKISEWDLFKEKIFFEISNSIFNRIKYTYKYNIYLSIVLSSFSESIYYLYEIIYLKRSLILQDHILFYMSSFGFFITILFIISIIIRSYSISFISKKEKDNFDLDKYLNFYGFLSNSKLSDLGSSKEFIDKINRNIVLGGVGTGVALGEGDPLLALVSISISFIFNEFSGKTLQEQKEDIIKQINNVFDNLENAYSKSFDALEVTLKEALEIMRSRIQIRYKDILIKDFEDKEKKYLINKAPLDKFEHFFRDIEKITKDTVNDIEKLK